ncbi:hypothetical protein X771_11595 [Mesorhizobium sp. LSJC277A00]|nr:hypothetical protein X771_11595 [Mesorhizobium sp. LSJC277A00]
MVFLKSSARNSMPLLRQAVMITASVVIISLMYKTDAVMT